MASGSKLQLRSKLQELVLRAVIAKNVEVVNDVVVTFEENKVQFSDDVEKPFQLFDFFPEHTSVKVHNTEQCMSHVARLALATPICKK